jgi:hypothetical protein
LSGKLSDGTWTAEVLAYRNPWTGRGSNAAPWQGTYTAIIPGASDASLLPGGDGVVTLSLTAAGAVKGAATLGDTTPVTFGAAVSASGQWPLYVPLSGGRGLLLGQWAKQML